MRAKVVSKSEIAENTLLIEFEPEERLSYLPGQYLVLGLISPRYTDERGSIRIFSIVSCVDESHVSVATRISSSAFKRSLKELVVGEFVVIKSVGGRFTLPGPEREIVMIAGGIGITPFMSMIRSAWKINPGYDITLLYSNRTLKSTAFLEVLRALASNNQKFRLVLNLTQEKSWSGEAGRIDEAFVRRYVREPENVLFMIVGPQEMLADTTALLRGMGIEEVQIMSESFSGI
jgi:ferredoxin-NADP reductase